MEEKEIKAWDKTAKKYFEEVDSPFAKGVENPIYWYIDNKIDSSKKKSVIDVGTGIGNMIPFLSKKFKEIVAIDISSKMIEQAKKTTESMDNVKLLVRDAKDLTEFYNQFDVAVSVNAILSPKIADIEKILLEIYNVLNDEGVLIAIFPSMDAILYRAVLEHEKAIEEGSDEKEALEKTNKAINVEDCDFVLGTVKYHDMTQKHYYRFELLYRLWKAGFKNIRMRKVNYPWEMQEQEELQVFKGKPELWDWFVFAEKKI